MPKSKIKSKSKSLKKSPYDIKLKSNDGKKQRLQKDQKLIKSDEEEEKEDEKIDYYVEQEQNQTRSIKDRINPYTAYEDDSDDSEDDQIMFEDDSENNKQNDRKPNVSFSALSRSQQKSKAVKTPQQEDEDSSDGAFFEEDDDDEPEEETITKKRGKHAPREESTKFRHRRFGSQINEAKKSSLASRANPYGDIRFDPAYGPANFDKTRKNYSFLDDYRKDEINSMKDLLKSKKGKNLSQYKRQELETKIKSEGSRLETLKQRDFDKKVLEERSRKENELIKQGKTPFFLKRSAKKELLLKEKFKTMKKSQIDKTISRKRKKVAGKELKQLPYHRRG